MKIDKDELLFAKAFIDEHFARIVDWAVGDIKRCCRMREDGTCEEGGALVGAFILWCCAIDYFGGLFSNNPSGKTIDRYKAFITKYMKKYDYQKVYDLRWSLLHYYSPHHFVLYHENNLEQNKSIHLTQTKGGIMLHLGWVVKDLAGGVNQYWSELKKNDSLKINAWRYYKKQYPIIPIKVEQLLSAQTFNSLPTGANIRSFVASGTIAQEFWLKK